MENLALTLLPLALAYIMFTLGIGLTVNDFRQVVTHPKAFFMGIFNQMLIVPTVAFILVMSTSPPPAIAFGIMLLSFCPGGTTSGLLTHYGKGNVALSLSLTGVVSLVSMVSLPLLIVLAYGHFMTDAPQSVSMTKMSLLVFLITALPVLLGMVVRHKAPNFVSKFRKLFERLATVFFVIIVIAVIATNFPAFKGQVLSIGAILVAMIAILFAIGIGSSRLFGLNWYDSKTIAIESSIQNGTAAIALSPIIMNTSEALPEIALPAAAYSVLMYVVGIPLVLLLRNKT